MDLYMKRPQTASLFSGKHCVLPKLRNPKTNDREISETLGSCGEVFLITTAGVESWGWQHCPETPKKTILTLELIHQVATWRRGSRVVSPSPSLNSCKTEAYSCSGHASSRGMGSWTWPLWPATAQHRAVDTFNLTMRKKVVNKWLTNVYVNYFVHALCFCGEIG